MSKFKVGDRVVVVKNNHPSQGNYHPGTRGEVISTSDEKEYEVGVQQDKGGLTCFDTDELELESVYDALSAKPAEETPLSVGQVDSRPEDVVNHPSHYTSHPSGIECIQVTEHMLFNPGNAIKYLWRAGLKDEGTDIQDLQKAIWYIEREIKRLGGTVG